jgi:acylphosphatase
MSPTTDEPILALHATIEGRVQGVGFRAFVAETAMMLDLLGWVRNRWDGSVETLAEGPRPQLEKFLEALKRGPSMAYVTTVTPEWLPATGQFNRFSVTRTE